MSRIERTFRTLKDEGRRAFIPYIMAGAPSIRRTEEIFGSLVAAGADIVELGVPFTDPVADGPAIQRAAERAISQGVTLRQVLALVGRLRLKSEVPIVLMTYYNPVYRYGEEAFFAEAARVGVDGVIVPDLPPDEAHATVASARRAGVDVIFLLAPNATPARLRMVARASSGFTYYVSIMGITGAHLKLEPQVVSQIEEARRAGRKPVCLGFGVSTPEEAHAVAEFADGVIVGSAIVRRTEEPGLDDFLADLRSAIG
jgi:tryptophan synthase alpha chain